MENQKKPTEKKSALGGNPFDVNTDASTAMVCCGPYREALPVVGMTVGDVRTKFADRLELHADATAIINGNEVDNNTKIGSNEVLMFIHKAGEKG